MLLCRLFQYPPPPTLCIATPLSDLVDNGAIPPLLWDMLAPPWRPVYLERESGTDSVVV